MKPPAKPARSALLVFESSRDSKCGECGADLGRHAWITLCKDKGALCLECADLDHLVFLPPGDATLTRRATKESRLSAVVLKWSKARKRYERQGILVEDTALDRAEQQCAADAATREAKRAEAAARRAELDQDYIAQFAARIRELYLGCPNGRERLIAEHACRKYSGRIGRTTMAKELEEKAIRLAVIAHVRHTETKYDDLLLGGMDRLDARREVEAKVGMVLAAWERGRST